MWSALRQVNRLLVVLAMASLAFASPACGDDAGPDPATAGSAPSGRLTVFAAASLTDVFNELGGEFEKANPRVEVAFNFAGSPTLRTQLEQGARADVFASADQVQMELALQNGVVATTGSVFVRNLLVVITPVSNPGRITAIGDLKRPGLKLVLANPEVPAGAYARQMLEAMEKDAAYGSGFRDAVLKNVVSLESNVKQVVAKVELGEVDAGIVYRSDVTPSVAGKLSTIAVPHAFNVRAEYPIALTKDAANRRAGRAFIDFVLSATGQRVLQRYGFEPVN